MPRSPDAGRAGALRCPPATVYVGTEGVSAGDSRLDLGARTRAYDRACRPCRDRRDSADRPRPRPTRDSPSPRCRYGVHVLACLASCTGQLYVHDMTDERRAERVDRLGIRRHGRAPSPSPSDSIREFVVVFIHPYVMEFQSGEAHVHRLRTCA
ncbi:hypothetical protein GY45DRAFT_240511 [Cubamyces sp. BRFM 1775]|nr:hypothetical protein GY45DRAFT_240511 [Cubamyces sp. BRFM 1775]